MAAGDDPGIERRPELGADLAAEPVAAAKRLFIEHDWRRHWLGAPRRSGPLVRRTRLSRQERYLIEQHVVRRVTRYGRYRSNVERGDVV